MKIALLSDIHANLPALESVLAHADSIGVRDTWCLGDLVLFNAFPDETVRTVRKLKGPCITGNIDRKVLETAAQLGSAALPELPAEVQPFAWNYAQLSPKNREFLRKLPEQIEIEAKDHRFLLVHGSPAGIEDPIYMDTPEERLLELATGREVEFILCGHTHRPFLRQAGGVHFLNPGSVGRPIDGDPRASYAVLDIRKRSVAVEFFRVAYSVSIAVDALRTAGQPELFACMVEAGLPPDQARERLAAKDAAKP